MDQCVRVPVGGVGGVAAVAAGLPLSLLTVGGPLAHASSWRPSEPRERFRVRLDGQRDEVEAIGDRAEKAALAFHFGRATRPPPFEISN
ncbi:hypothetical protein ACQP0U_01325 [Micromonospora sp. CA-269861]|uniref:hypothetical protein n=1 Tax=Micromonospora sp. CA-269861 TaxID=3239968 RepID=UPI003D92C40B